MGCEESDADLCVTLALSKPIRTFGDILPAWQYSVALPIRGLLKPSMVKTSQEVGQVNGLDLLVWIRGCELVRAF